MANSKISGLPLATTPLAGTEVLPIVQGGATNQVSVDNLTAGRAVSATEFIGPLTDSTYRRIYNPNGGTYIRTGVTDTGAIRVKFPIGVNAEFVNITLKVIENDSPNLTFEAHFGGYVNGPWIGNCFAYIVGSPNTNRQFTVRFGWDGSNRLFVYIGELNSSWVNAAISITEVQTGYGTASPIWTSGWEIDFVSSAFQNVTDTITAPQVGYLVASGNTAQGSVQYSGTTSTAGTFDGGTTTPTATNRLNYSGNFYPTALNLVGTGDTATAATHYIVETGSDGFLRPKTLANTQAEIVTNASVSAAISSGLSTLTVTGNTFLATTSGDVGIGTSSPGVKLDVQGVVPFIRLKENTTGYLGFRAENNSGNFYLGIDNSTGSFYGSAYARVLYADGAYPMVFYTNATERMRITAAGDVGIGTSTPYVKFDVANGFISTGANSANPGLGGNIRFRDDTGAPRWLNGLLGSAGATSYSIYDIVAGAERLSINSSGDVGIGTSSPTAKLDVSASAANQAIARLNNSDTNDGNGLYIKAGGINAGKYALYVENGSGTALLNLLASGNLGLGVTPSAWSGATGLQVLNACIYAAGNIIGSAGNSYLADAGANDKYIANGTAVKYLGNVSGDHRWYTAPSGTAGNAISFTQAMTLDAAGNLGLGVTPSAWGSGVSGLQVGSWASLSSANAYGTGIGFNNYYNGTNDIYSFSNGASKLELGSGTFKFYIAPSGTAGNAISFTQAMTLDAAGNLGIGVTPSAWGGGGNFNLSGDILGGSAVTLGTNWYFNGGFKYTATGTASRFYLDSTGGYAWFTAPSGTAGNPITFTQAMTLDASGNLGVGTSSPGDKLTIAAGRIRLDQDYQIVWQNAGTNRVRIYGDSGNSLIFENGSSNTERMRLDSSGNLGIGTTSPAYTLDVVGATGNSIRAKSNSGSTGNYAQLILDSYNSFSGTGQAYIRGISSASGNSNTDLTFGVNASGFGSPYEAMRLDSSGNLGLGVTPSAWGSNWKSISVDFYGALSSIQTDASVNLSSNTFNNGTNWIYRETGVPASLYKGSVGIHSWFTAPSGTAGNAISFTQAMTLDASGNLLVGLTSTPSGWGTSGRISVKQVSNARTAGIVSFASGNENAIFIGHDGSVGAIGTSYATSGSFTPLAFYTSGTERMRITSSGDFIVGGTTATNTAAGRGNITINGSSSAILSIGTAGSEKGYVYTQGSDFIVNATTGNLSLQTQTASPLTLFTNNTERMRITAAGDVGIGTTSPTYKADIQVASGADQNILLAGVTGASNGFHVRWINSTAKTHVIISDIPTSSSGLAAGTLWNDGGTIKIA